MRDRGEEVAARLLGLYHAVALRLEPRRGGTALERERQHVRGHLERRPVVVGYPLPAVQVVERNPAPGLPVALHYDDLERPRGAVARDGRDGLPFRVRQLDHVLRVLGGRNLQLVERARLAPPGACLHFSVRMQHQVIAVDGMDRDVVALGQLEKAVHHHVDQSRDVVLRERVRERVGAELVVVLHHLDRVRGMLPRVREREELGGRADSPRHLLEVVVVRLRVVYDHLPPSALAPELRDDGRRHRAVRRKVHLWHGIAISDYHRLAPREELRREPLLELDRRPRAGAAALRRVRAEPVAPRAVLGVQHQVLRAGDLADLCAHEVPHLRVFLVSEQELHHLALEVRDAERDGKLVVRRDPLQGHDDDERRAAQEVLQCPRKLLRAVVAHAEDADKLPLLARAEAVEGLQLREARRERGLDDGLLPDPAEVAFEKRDHGAGL